MEVAGMVAMVALYQLSRFLAKQAYFRRFSVWVRARKQRVVNGYRKSRRAMRRVSGVVDCCVLVWLCLVALVEWAGPWR